MKRSRGTLLGSQHFGGRGTCQNSRMGPRRLTSTSITHTDLNKPNNKLVSAQLEHFGAWMIHRQTWTHKTHHGPNLQEATTFPLIIYYVPGHKTSIQMSFCHGSPKIPIVGTLATLGFSTFSGQELNWQIDSRPFF